MRARRDNAMRSALGQRIRIERKRRDLTLRDLAERAGIDPCSLSRIEHGSRGGPVLEVLVRIADGLDVSVDSLLGRDVRGDVRGLLDVPGLLEQAACELRQTRAVASLPETLDLAARELMQRERGQ